MRRRFAFLALIRAPDQGCGLHDQRRSLWACCRCLCARLASVDPNAGSGFELEAIAEGPARLVRQFTIWFAGYCLPGNGISPTWGARTCEATRRRRSNRGLLSNPTIGAARRTIVLNLSFGFAALGGYSQKMPRKPGTSFGR